MRRSRSRRELSASDSQGPISLFKVINYSNGSLPLNGLVTEIAESQGFLENLRGKRQDLSYQFEGPGRGHRV